MLAVALGTLSAHAQQKLVWQIGKFDHASQEFRSTQGYDYTSTAPDVIFNIGVDDPAKAFPRFQPGQANGIAGGRLHPVHIVFDVPGQPAGVYTLRVAVLYETPRLSALRVSVNGHAGLFYFHPELDYGAGDWEGTFVPQASHDEKSIAIPSQWLTKGRNEITLTATDDPATPERSLGDIAPGISGLVYDALSLSQNPTPRPGSDAISAIAIPSIFYKQQGDVLREVVDVYLSLPAGGMLNDETITLTDRGTTLRQRLPHDDSQFGEVHVPFEVPEWTGTHSAAIGVGGRSFPVDLAAQKKWTILVVPHEHLDIGFTDYREKVAELQSQSVDGVLSLLHQHPDFRWTLDGSWVAEQFLAGRSEQKKEQFFAAVRAGQIVIPPQYANQHTGVASLEGLFRSLYYSHSLAAENKIPIGEANITDVPSYSWSYASVLHDSGIKYLTAGSNSWRAPIMLLGRWNEESPFYWEGPDRSRVLMWYSRAYLQLASMFGSPPSLNAIHDALPIFLQAYSRADYASNSVLLYGTQLENTPLVQEQVTLPARWAKIYAWPRFQFSTVRDGMASIEADFKGKIPVVRGDFGPYWEDGFTSQARPTAVHRQNQQRILTAEKMSLAAQLQDASLRPDQTLLRDAWRNSLLFDEHTWTYVGATTQPESQQTLTQISEKGEQVGRAQSEIRQSIERGWAQLESRIAPATNSLVVFNSLSWSRSGWVEADLPFGTTFVKFRDEQIPLENIREEAFSPMPGFGDKLMRARFWASDIPAMGYKVFGIGDVPTKSEPPAPGNPRQRTVENRYYRITIDDASGSLSSIFDKQLQRELVDAHSPYRFGAYVYTTGADDMPYNSLYRYGIAQHQPDLVAHAAGGGHVLSLVTSPSSTTIVMESSALHTPSVRTTITLPAQQKSIEFTYAIQKEAVLSKEAVYIAFPFAVDHPAFAYDTQNGWVEPARDELAGGSREWYAATHWAGVHNDSVAVAVIPHDAPLVNFGDIVRGAWPAEFKPASSTIFSWLMSNYWGTNFAPQQGGDFTFRYTLLSDRAFDPASLTRRGWEEMTPLETDAVAAQKPFANAVTDQLSLLQIDNPNVVAIAWKRAEDGKGSILRLEEIAGAPQTAILKSNEVTIDKIAHCNALEDCEASVTPGTEVSLTLQPFQVMTLRLQTKLKERSQ